ncbi:MAG TPA: clostripain-related cysteine peptidase [Anaerolineales bacterium]|nr:clostripain-related cysteine peptidase [Anaerolineales bacterium]HNH03904.1 clostripain-related cysteine peptidase [Anaerolineales bacterium]HNH78521.1 clostripain-related cysteine peptidase [Anaerolineales bacterium]HUM25876.1 clostripain-related cysteine peptidase [Anaerolineales bacterium]
MGNTTSKIGIPVIIAAVVICIACVCCAGVLLYIYGDSIFGGTSVTTPPVVSTDPIIPADTTNLPEWTIIYYSDADDDILEGDLWFDINEMELVGSNTQMNIVVQIDRAEGSFDGDGDWTDARRLLITQDSDLNQINSPVVQNLGEVDMGNPQTLVDFMTWTIQNYPAKKYALIMSDHGGGWTGGFSDLQSGSSLSMPQIVQAIEVVQQQMGGQKFEIIGFDACLMGMVEVYGSLYPYSNYMIASEEVIPSTGWSYAAWMGQLAQNPSMDGRGVSQAIISTYITQDTLLTLRSTSSSEIEEVEAATTLSAVESARIPDVIGAMNQFISVMATIDQRYVAQAREYTRSYYSIFGEDTPSPFIDLGNFSEILANATGDPAIFQASEQLKAAISSAVVAEKHGQRMSGSNGISFHFPISDIYAYTEYNSDFPPYYAESAARFLQLSTWDEFLAYHYTGQEFIPQEGQAYTPPRTNEINAPGASPLTIAPIQLSDTVISADETLTLSTTVSGDVSYIYFVLFFYNQDANVTWLADMSFVSAPNTISVDGVNAPDYGESPIEISYEWEPYLFVLKDGTNQAYALFEPDEYESADGVTTYSVYGQYTPVNATTPTDAKLTFDLDGNLLNIYALPDSDSNGIDTAVAISPQIGDRFTDYVQYYTFDANGVATYTNELSDDVFTYGEQGFWFESYIPVDGQYSIGFYAVDFDNNITSSYEYITYQNAP